MDSGNLKINGELIPGNTKWAWLPKKSYNWLIEAKFGPVYAEAKVIEQIKMDMVFTPDNY